MRRSILAFATLLVVFLIASYMAASPRADSSKPHPAAKTIGGLSCFTTARAPSLDEGEKNKRTCDDACASANAACMGVTPVGGYAAPVLTCADSASPFNTVCRCCSAGR